MKIIGAVKADIHKHEHQFKLISFSDIDCIKGLIKNRCIVDPYRGIDTDNDIYNAGIVQPINQEIIVLFADLDTLIEKSRLNEKQKTITDMLMDGWTEEDIAKRFKQKLNKIQQILDTVCSKIKKTNDYDWKYGYIYLNHLPTQWEYKECSKCGEWKPKMESFFTLDRSRKDGFFPYCKECNK